MENSKGTVCSSGRLHFIAWHNEYVTHLVSIGAYCRYRFMLYNLQTGIQPQVGCIITFTKKLCWFETNQSTNIFVGAILMVVQPNLYEIGCKAFSELVGHPEHISNSQYLAEALSPNEMELAIQCHLSYQ